MFCSECGNPLEDDAAFCSNCGRRLYRPGAANDWRPTSPAMPSRAPAPFPWLRCVAILILVAAVAAGAAYIFKPEWLGLSAPEKTIYKFVKAYNEKDVNVMLTCFDSRIERGFKGIGNIFGGLFGVNSTDLFEIFPMLAGVVANQPGNSQLENIEILQKSVSGDAATVLVRLTERVTVVNGSKSSRTQVRFVLKRESSGWRIIDMQGLL